MWVLRRFFAVGLLAVILVVATFSPDAMALEIWRNQQRYDIDVRLPKGATFEHQGVDRRFSLNGIDGNLRLIQDNYSGCEPLIDERQQNRRKDGFTASSDRTVSRRECGITLTNPSNSRMMTSHYIWLDACKCFAAVHLSYASKNAGSLGKVSGPLLSSLRGGTGAATQTKDAVAKQPLAIGKLDKRQQQVVEALAILKQRGFSFAKAGAILVDARPFREYGRFGHDQRVKLVASLYAMSVASVEASYNVTDDPLQGESSHGLAVYGFDLQTGADLSAMSPVQFAKSISSCYRNTRYWQHCKLTYHQEMGCRMTKKWQAVCKGYRGTNDDAFVGDACFWEPKGDLPMLPARASAEKTVELPKVADAKPAATGRKKQSGKASQPQRPYCEEDLWPELFGGN